MFYEAVKNDLANSKETLFNITISTTLSLITVLFEDIRNCNELPESSQGAPR
jgi:hypothetical protein